MGHKEPPNQGHAEFVGALYIQNDLGFANRNNLTELIIKSEGVLQIQNPDNSWVSRAIVVGHIYQTEGAFSRQGKKTRKPETSWGFIQLARDSLFVIAKKAIMVRAMSTISDNAVIPLASDSLFAIMKKLPR